VTDGDTQDLGLCSFQQPEGARVGMWGL